MNGDIVPITEYSAVREDKFKRLKMLHRKVIALHVQAYTATEIDRMLGKQAGYANRVLGNEAVTPILDRIYAEHEMELRALFPLTVDAVRRGLQDGDVGESMRAADLWHKIHGTYEKAKDKGDTAEDVIERIREQITSDGDVTRVIERRKVRLLNPVEVEHEVVQNSDASTDGDLPTSA